MCPSCDAPAADGTLACAACGAKLVRVASEPDLVGTIVDGRFEIVAKLGQGGMGTVYRAKQRSIGREVALKLIDRRFERDATAVKRFLREAKLASQLVHPSTVGVIEFGQGEDGRLYLAMELVPGRTLYEISKQSGPLPNARIIRIGIQLVDALEAAHALSIVHRDLKLENVMVLERDLVKVLDFGLARSIVEVDGRATDSGLIAGTPRYLAPEVLDGAPPAPAQDLYALGVLLGELATGGPLWDAPTVESLLAVKIHGQPKLDGIAPALRTLVAALLDRDPAARPSYPAIRAALLGLDGAVGLAATQELAMPTVSAVAPPPTSSAFAPPGPAAAPLELEEAWGHEKAARLAATAATPPRPRVPIAAVLVAIAIIGIVGAVVAVIATRPPEHYRDDLPVTAGTVSIEIRANPIATVTIDGRSAGRTPLTLHVGRSEHSVTIGATLAGHPLTRSVVPDHDQTIDFTLPRN